MKLPGPAVLLACVSCLACLTVMFLYHLVASDHLSRTSSNVALGLIAGLGLLMKVLFPLYVAGPFLMVWWQTRRSGSQPWKALTAIALPAALLAATWYPFHLSEVFRYAWQAGYGEITTEVESDQPFYYAEAYHQQYLAKNPNGYCGIGGTGVSCPVGLTA